ncbi:unnamed protein product [Staurois parvus]|uniref:Uncharacterized protein n=1 Tax=Staurois parvus TaxID=386267 RepID=A0ABN9BP09_9NEOB|nr:unnamed protein product [Staurois parvus]
MCRLATTTLYYGRWIGDCERSGGSKKTGSNSLFTQCRGLTPYVPQ